MLERGRKATEEQFTEFVAGAYRPLVQTARLMVGDHHVAEDLVQSTLERVYVRWQRSASWESPYAYTRRVLINQVLKSAKRKWHGEVAHAELPDAAASTSDGADPDRHDLALALRALSTDQRVVLVLRYFEDLTVGQTAHVLGCSTGTVKSRTNRALATLRASGALAAYSERGRP